VNGEHAVVKTDDDPRTMTNEVDGHRRAAAAGVCVPELLGAVDDAFAMRWVDGVTLRRHPTAAAWRAAGREVRFVHDVDAEPPFGTGFGGFNPSRPTWRQFFELFADQMLTSCERDLGLPRAEGDRIRAALHDAPGLDTPHVVWCHGDLQPEHILVDPATDRVTAIIDWADHGAGDFVWDFAVLTLDGAPTAALLDGYGATREQCAALDALLPLYSVVRLVGEAGWFAEHGFPYADNLRRALERRLD
jgi:aminoglycoside phosphotransferase (APT) family kinase protein